MAPGRFAFPLFVRPFAVFDFHVSLVACLFHCSLVLSSTACHVGRICRSSSSVGEPQLRGRCLDQLDTRKMLPGPKSAIFGCGKLGLRVHKAAPTMYAHKVAFLRQSVVIAQAWAWRSPCKRPSQRGVATRVPWLPLPRCRLILRQSCVGLVNPAPLHRHKRCVFR